MITEAESLQKKEYYQKNRGKILAYKRKFYQENKEKFLRKGREYYLKNRTRLLEYHKEKYSRQKDWRELVPGEERLPIPANTIRIHCPHCGIYYGISFSREIENFKEVFFQKLREAICPKCKKPRLEEIHVARTK